MMDALVEAGYPFNDRDFLWFSTESKHSFMETQAARRLLGECDALICYNDEIVEMLLPLLTADSGITYLYSFDGNLNLNLMPAHIRYHSLRHPKEKLGVAATETLLQMIRGGAATSAVLPWEGDTTLI